jgi:hypothetical protein
MEKRILQNYTLADVEQAYLRGEINEIDRDEYIGRWNACPDRDIVAYWNYKTASIRQKHLTNTL